MYQLLGSFDETENQDFAYAALAASLAIGFSVTEHAQHKTLINVSYHPTRELYRKFNEAFASYS